MLKYIAFAILFIALVAFSQNKSDNTDELNRYSMAAENQFHKGNIDSSIVYYRMAIQLANEMHDSIKLTTLIRKQANALEFKGDFNEAQSAYLKAINFGTHLFQKTELGFCYLGLSNVHYRIFNTESALSNGIEASRIFKELQDTSNYIHASELIAQVYLSLEKYDDALLIANEMLELAKVSSDSLKWVNSLNILGAVYSFKKEYDLAYEIYREAANMSKVLGNKVYEGITLGNIGEMYLRKRQYQKALNSLFEALEIEKKQNFNSGIIFLYYTLGETYSNLGIHDEAMAYFNKSIDLIEKLGELREKPTVYRLIAEHFERNSNFENAYRYYKTYKSLNDSLDKITSSLKVEEIKVKFEIDKKDYEYQLLLKEKSIQEKELTSKKKRIRLHLIVLLLVVVGLISSFTFTLYFFRSRKKLKSINQTKDILFSIIGHDLRGPVGSVKQIVEVIQKPDVPDRDKYIKMLNQPIQSAFILLDDLLAWSGTLNNNTIVEPRLIPVKDCIDKTFDLLKSQADKKNINLVSNVPKDVLIFAEYNHVNTILRNLVSNAIKFTPENGIITISHESANKYVKIIVSDTGVGIEPQNITKILDSSTFFSTYGTNNEHGSGLGLVLCQKFVELNRGAFGIKSTLGKGSDFYFTLPNSSL